jgi:general L-amino acid transport system permease protein
MTDMSIVPTEGVTNPGLPPKTLVNYVRMENAEALPPPASLAGWQGWVRENLLSSPLNIVMTIVSALLLYWIFVPLLSFTIFNAVWTGTDREACIITEARPVVGACWPFVFERFEYFVYGSYPVAERWRPTLFFALLVTSIVWLLARGRQERAAWITVGGLVGVWALAYLMGWAGRNASLFLLLTAAGVGAVLWTGGARKDLAALFAFVITPFLSYWLLTGSSSAYALIGIGLLVLKLLAGALAAVGSLLQLIPVIGPVLAIPFLIWDWAMTELLRLVGSLFSARGFFWFDLFASAALVAAWLQRNRLRMRGAEFRTALITLAVMAGAYGLFVAATGLDRGLPPVPTNLWGGILISLIVAAFGIVFSLPLGILLALGRRSKMPAVKLFAVIVIEFVRGVPFITVLFMASNMLPLFVPEQYAPDKLLRALIAAVIFASAYMAEVVRAGLQALPKGQYEGAMAMGLGYWQMMRLIILPQALKVTIPNIVNTYIGLFKDTTLVVVVGLFDFLKTIEAARIDPKWAAPTTSATGYMFAAIFYFICCYAMSRYAKATEERLAQADRR